MEFGDASCTCDCRGNSDCSDCRAAASLVYLKKIRAVDEIHFPRAFFVTKNRVGAEAGYG